MKADRISYHESVLTLYERIKKDKMNNIWDRYEAQGMGGNPDQRCPFCLPVAAVAPEYMEQKATIDAIFALAFGLYTYVNPVPPIIRAPNLIRLLLEDCKDVTGGHLNVETDPVKAVDGILSHIEEKRKKLGI